MSKQILFSYEPTTDRFKAECAVIENGLVWGESKWLTNQEVDGLSWVVDFSVVATETGAFHRFTVEELEPCFGYGDLDDTNFATIYNKFAKENN